jgi:hypothetical protein
MPNVVRLPDRPVRKYSPAREWNADEQNDLREISRQLARLQAATSKEIRGGVLLLEIAVFRLREAVGAVAADLPNGELDDKLHAIEELLDAARAAARTI